jgi:hypothetical protein
MADVGLPADEGTRMVRLAASTVAEPCVAAVGSTVEASMAEAASTVVVDTAAADTANLGRKILE